MHRKWLRFLGLSAASAASLCLGAFLSYQAATQAESAAAPLSEAAGEAGSAAAELAPPAVPVKSAEALVPAPAPVAAPASAPAPVSARPMVLASLETDAPPIFSPSNALASPLELRMEEQQQQDLDAALPDNGLATPADPQPLPDAAIASPEGQGLFHGKPAPLPPVRPASLKIAPAEVVAALPEPPVPPGAGPEAVVAPPSATISASASPQAPVARTAPPAATVAASSQSSFPSVANALAAVTASVGGASAAVTPMQPPVATAPDSGAEVGGFKKGSPVYVRIFKKEGVLELWLKRGDNYALYKSFPVCKWSGQLGPKTRQADYQSPEGFYSVSARQLNPNSHYHLAFDIGYPNAYDRRQGSTGNSVMVHGDCKSVGCFAMTNDGIDEIYALVEAALRNGQREVPVHIFPFRMTEEAIARENAPKQFMAFLAPVNPPPPQRDWSSFWHNLKQGYDMFERSHVPPVAFACGDRYEFGAAAGSCARIAGW
jgi:murein L,D-transpeptidase YafK